jgi:hypothetical protein
MFLFVIKFKIISFSRPKSGPVLTLQSINFE